MGRTASAQFSRVYSVDPGTGSLSLLLGLCLVLVLLWPVAAFLFTISFPEVRHIARVQCSFLLTSGTSEQPRGWVGVNVQHWGCVLLEKGKCHWLLPLENQVGCLRTMRWLRRDFLPPLLRAEFWRCLSVWVLVGGPPQPTWHSSFLFSPLRFSWSLPLLPSLGLSLLAPQTAPWARRWASTQAEGFQAKLRRPQGAPRVRVRCARGGQQRGDYRATFPWVFPD